jgi:6-phosphogluconate dehydrogenase
MEKADIGLAGLTAKGRGLALRMERRGYAVAVFDPAWEKTAEFMQGPAKGRNIFPAKTPAELAEGLKPPRRALLAVEASAVDETVGALAALFEPGDMLFDCGDACYADTARREKALAAKGLRFMGVGLAGGGEGARDGPCVMTGGAKDTWLAAGRVFMDISARAGDGSPCCAWVGPGGAGHFAQAAHDGIECACMQLIAECYGLMKELPGIDAPDMQMAFRLWNTGALESHLIKITCDILDNTDQQTGRPLLDLIPDEAGPQGSGRWACGSAAEAGVPAPTIAEAVYAGSLSGLKHERMLASRQIAHAVDRPEIDRYAFIDDIGQALHAAMVCVFAQGFAILRAAPPECGLNLNPGEIAALWRGGSPLRSRMLDTIREAYGENPLLSSLMLAPVFRQALEEAQPSWRKVVSAAALSGVPAPCLASALSYFDGYRAAELPASLIRAQRDDLGEQKYPRTDMPGEFHTEWEKE